MKSNIQDILDSGRAPGITTDTPKVEHDSVYHKAPRGLSAIENEPRFKHGPTRSAKDISRYFGMPTDFIRKTWARAPLVLLLLCFCFSVKGGSITAGVNFTDGSTVSAAQLMNLVNLATINSTFISGQPIDPAPLGSDTIILYSPTLNGLYKITFNSSFLQNSNLIAAQLEKTTPATNDYVLILDSVSGTLEKLSMANLVLNNTNLIAGQPFIVQTNLSPSAILPILNFGTNGQTTFSNLLATLEYVRSLTNLVSATQATNNDGFLFYDSTHNAQKFITISNLFNLPPLLTAPTNGDFVLVWTKGTNLLNPNGTNSYIAAVPVQDLGPRTMIVANLPCTNQTIFSTNHGFISTPVVRASLVVTNAGLVGLGYINSDEIPLDRIYDNAASKVPAFNYGASTNLVYLNANFAYGSGINIPQKSGSTGNAALFNESPTNFSLKLYITFLPPQ